MPLAATEPELATKTWAVARRSERIGRTVVLKLKTSEFRILTRSRTPLHPPRSAVELTELALELRGHVDAPAGSLYRLVGVGLANFVDAEDTPRQPELLDGGPVPD